jgi:HAD superfamily hydrolase (TIGR01509 family)
MLKAVLFDIDGTLVDSNDAHAHAWENIRVEFAAVRRAIGMGGDKLMPSVAGITEDSSAGRRVATKRQEIFEKKYLPQLRPFPSARALVEAIKKRGLTGVAASSAKKDELKALLEIAGVANLLDAATSSDDAEESKPDPDIVHAALKRAKSRPGDAVMIGDTPYDVEAASKAGVAVIAFRSGGWSDNDLRGAREIYDDPADLLARIDSSLLSRS